jgi:hypothetical protein
MNSVGEHSWDFQLDPPAMLQAVIYLDALGLFGLGGLAFFYTGIWS